MNEEDTTAASVGCVIASIGPTDKVLKVLTLDFTQHSLILALSCACGGFLDERHSACAISMLLSRPI